MRGCTQMKWEVKGAKKKKKTYEVRERKTNNTPPTHFRLICKSVDIDCIMMLER
jgi:hypothetical protein